MFFWISIRDLPLLPHFCRALSILTSLKTPEQLHIDYTFKAETTNKKNVEIWENFYMQSLRLISIYNKEQLNLDQLFYNIEM